MFVLIVNGRLQEKNRPVVFFQGGIHAGEIDGKDAGFWLLKDWLSDNKRKAILSQIMIVFVPVFNVDGHERFGKNNRPNQNGPEETGFRVTSQNLNLNRDYMKAESLEMIAMLALMRKWNPILFLDLHVTDGAQFRQDLGFMVSPTLKGMDPIRELGQKFSERTIRELSSKGFFPVSFYPSFVSEDEPESGFEVGVAPPRFSQSYWALRNRIGVLVETHSWRPYEYRVKLTRAVLESVLEQAAQAGKGWLEASSDAENRASQISGTEVEMTYEPTSEKKQIPFEGYAYGFETSPITGKKIIRYDTAKPETWKVPFFFQLKPKLVIQAPLAGYWVPPEWAKLVKTKLDVHGIRSTSLPAGQREVQAFRAVFSDFGKLSFEGRQNLSVRGQWWTETVTLASGGIFVPIQQPLSHLVMHLLEPEAPDSLLSWGFFNSHFEQKEYIEAYVLEPWAREVLARDPKVKKAFEQRLKEDPEFEKSAEKRLDFFYELHPAMDKGYRRYPLLRLNSR
jgi:hypothetical protein